MIMDILAPDRGEVRLFGRPRQAADSRRIGYLPEERGLYRKMTVEEQLLFLARLQGIAAAEARRRVGEWLARIELADWAKRKVETLSKGMQQKIQLVATVIHDPDLLILDEPFSGLDPINQGLFKELLAGFRERGKTILFSTHVLEQAEKLCDGIALIARGRVVLSGELATIKRERGTRAVEATFERAPETLDGLSGAAHVELRDEKARIDLTPGTTPAALLSELIGRGLAVADYHSLEPDLESIFVQAVRDAG